MSDDGKKLPLDVKAGDRILFGKYSGSEVKIDGVEYLILREEDVLGIRTTPERFAAVLGERPRARILLEASTESEWVARCLERLGHEVIVADPNFAPMYATLTRTIKTDRRGARALAEACRLGAYRPAHRLSDAQRHVRGRLTVRDALVRTRTVYISVIRALLPGAAHVRARTVARCR